MEDRLRDWVTSNQVVDQKKSHGNSQTTQDIAKAICCSPQTDNKSPITEKNCATN